MRYTNIDDLINYLQPLKAKKCGYLMAHISEHKKYIKYT